MAELAPELIGNVAARRYLRTLIDRGNVRGSYLFVGPAQLGKRATGLAFSQAIQCTASSRRAPCGVCPSCRAWRRGVHPDALIVERLLDRQGILLDQIRPTAQSAVASESAVHRRLQWQPLIARRQVVLIDGADRLTGPAANALLKTLEEPAGGTVFLLIAELPERLPPTVRSRCAGVSFSRVSTGEIRDWLQRSVSLSPRQLELVAHLADGRPGRAIELVHQPAELEAILEAAKDLLRRLTNLNQEPFGVSAILGLQERNPGQALELINRLSLVLHDLLLHAVGLPQLATFSALTQPVTQLAQRWGADRLWSVASGLVEARRRLERHLQPRTVLDALTNAVT